MSQGQVPFHDPMFANGQGIMTSKAWILFLQSLIRKGSIYCPDDTGIITIDCSKANGFYTILTGTGRTVILKNAEEDGVYRFLITQDGNGNRTITTWTATPAIDWLGGGLAPVLTSTAGESDTITFWYVNKDHFMGSLTSA